MEFDVDKVTTKEEDEKFFTEHKIEIIAACMILCPSKYVSDDDCRLNVQIQAMTMVAEKHNYGPFKNLCDTCTNEFSICESDPMFGLKTSKDNVCFCNEYIEE